MTVSKLIAIVSGSLIGAPLVACLGGISGRATAGFVCGAIVGGIVAYGAVTKRVSRPIAGAALTSVAFAVFGAACDEVYGYSACFGAFLGLLLGLMGWPWVFGVIGALVSLPAAGFLGSLPLIRAIPLSPGQYQLLGMAVGGILTVCASYACMYSMRPKSVDNAR